MINDDEDYRFVLPRPVCTKCGHDSVRSERPIFLSSGLGRIATRRVECHIHGWEVQVFTNGPVSKETIQTIVDEARKFKKP